MVVALTAVAVVVGTVAAAGDSLRPILYKRFDFEIQLFICPLSHCFFDEFVSLLFSGVFFGVSAVVIGVVVFSFLFSDCCVDGDVLLNNFVFNIPSSSTESLIEE